VTLVAGADTDADRLADFGADWRIAAEHLYTDYHELLARERPDLVSICAYAPERFAMARAAIESGARGLWLEKAVACSMAEADALRTLAHRAGVAVVVNHVRRADPAWRRVAEIVASEELGRLESVHCLFSGHFLHTGTHAWDLLDEWCGPWATVQCWGDEVQGHEAQGRRGAAAREEAQQGPPSPLRGFGGTSSTEAQGDRRSAGPVDADSGWAAIPRAPGAVSRDLAPESREPDPSGVAHIVFENGVHAFVSGSRKRYFIFQCDLVFTAGRIQIGNDVRRVFRPAPSPRYEGFIELEEASEPLETAASPSLLDALLDAIESGGDKLTSLDEAIRALHLGLAVVRASHTGAVLAPADLPVEFYVESV
jgi:predicted dehydrogenase